MMAERALSLCCCLALAALVPLAGAMTVDLSPAGDAAVTLEVNVTDAPAYLEFRALAKPVVARALLNGADVPVEFNETHVAVFADEPGLLVVTYVTQELTSKEGALWTLTAELPEETTILLPQGAVPTHIEPEPARVYESGGRFALVMPPSAVAIRYYLIPPPEAGAAQPPLALLTQPGLWAIVLGAAAVGAAAFALRRRRPARALDEREAAILDALSRRGPLTPHELMEETGIPKTPLFKRLKRLKEAGLVKVRLDERGRHVYEKA